MRIVEELVEIWLNEVCDRANEFYLKMDISRFLSLDNIRDEVLDNYILS